MKIFNKATVLTLLTTSLLLPGLVFAHAKLTEASPANGAVVTESPGVLELQFNEAVRLLSVTVTKADGQQVDVAFKPAAAANVHFSVSLPTLADGAYTVTGAIMGDDSHRVEVVLSFTVDADGVPVVNGASAPAEHPQGHKH